jgi:hypothetical protein
MMVSQDKTASHAHFGSPITPRCQVNVKDRSKALRGTLPITFSLTAPIHLPYSKTR